MILILASMMAVSPVAAENPAALMATERNAMKRLAWMDGEWRGTAVSKTPQGEVRSVHTERIGPLLGGTVKVVEGHAYRADGSTAFNALGVIRYDTATRTYRISSHADGRFGDYLMEPTADGYSWTIPAGPMTIRYRAVHKDGEWTETGERLVPGRPPMAFFEMKMRRIGSSNWPAANPVGMK